MRAIGLGAGLLSLLLTGCGGSGDDGGSGSGSTSFMVSATAGSGGSISPQSRSVAAGQTASFTVSAQSNYQIDSVTGCGGTLTGSTYTTAAIHGACSITASFRPQVFTVTTSAGTGGSIEPESLQLDPGETAALTIHADTGYQIDSVTGCSGSLSDDQYQIGPLTASCTVTAGFRVRELTVSASAGAGGEVEPSSQQVLYGEQAQITLVPDDGYVLHEFTGCAGEIDDLTFTSAAIAEDCSVTFSFVPSEITIATSSSEGGRLLPEHITVGYGERAEFAISTDSGFRFSKLNGCDGVFSGDRFIIESVTEACTLHADFNDAAVVEFADNRLAAVVRDTLGLEPDSDIMASQLAEELTVLHAERHAIQRLDGLQYATGLQALNLSSNLLDDVSLLTQLAVQQAAEPKLHMLDVSSNQLTALPDLSGFHQLSTLYLGFNELTELTALAGLNDLSTLEVTQNPVADLSDIAHLPLQNLRLNNTDIDSEQLWYLQQMPLVSLHLYDTDTESIEALSALHGLQQLDISYSRVRDLSPLKNLTALSWLASYGNRVIDISPLMQTSLVDYGTVNVGGCLKLDGFSRPQMVIDALNSQGATINVYPWATPTRGSCPTDDGIDSLTASADLSSDGLLVQWQVESSDDGPWRCELHVNLDFQLPRVPAAIIDDCHQIDQWLLDDFTLGEYQPLLLVDTGLVASGRSVEMDRVQSRDLPAGPYLASHDWMQVVVKSNPYLVPWRTAVLRLHVVSGGQDAPPGVSVVARHGAQQVALEVNAPETLPSEKQHTTLEQSYQVTIPASSMRPDTVFEVQLAGQEAVIIEPEFAEVNSIDLTVVPLTLGSTTTSPPDNEVIERSLTVMWPLASVSITNRQPFELSAEASSNNTSTMLYEVLDLRIAENSPNYYYGYFDRSINTDEWGGRGFLPGFASVGLVGSSAIDLVLTHELGHNFGIRHAPCGDAGWPDPDYPYDNGSIGSYGVAMSFNRLLSPTSHKDVMSYCGNKHVSDYNYEKVQDYLTANQSEAAIHLRDTSQGAPLASAALPAQADEQHASWYVRGRVQADQQVQIQQLMKLPHTASVRADGHFSVFASYDGQPPLLLPVEQLVLGHSEQADQPAFAFVVPAHHQGGALESWSLYQGRQFLFEHAMQSTAEPVTVQSAAAVTIEENGTEVCVDASAARFDSMNLLLVRPEGTTALALNETSAQFCRSSAQLPGDGQWQLQLRRGLTLQHVERSR